jgi:hypothetical protein
MPPQKISPIDSQSAKVAQLYPAPFMSNSKLNNKTKIKTPQLTTKLGKPTMNIKTFTTTTVIFTSLICTNIYLAKPLSTFSKISQNKQIFFTSVMRLNRFKNINNTTPYLPKINQKKSPISLTSKGR